MKLPSLIIVILGLSLCGLYLQTKTEPASTTTPVSDSILIYAPSNEPHSQPAPISGEPRADTNSTQNSKSLALTQSTKNIRMARIGTTVTTPSGDLITLKQYQTATIPNDPYANQWWQTFTGAQAVWDMPAPVKQTTLAIIDTGFAMQHEEFTNRFFKNAGESGPTNQEAPSALNCSARMLALNANCNLIDDNVDGIVDNEIGDTSYENPSALNCTDQSVALNKQCNRIDDDNNGYIDDVTGWDFVNADANPQAGELNPNGAKVHHGTMVAGIAAASANNSTGIAGADWFTQILPLQALDDDDYGDSLTVGNAIRYAADMNADVINISLGTPGQDTYILQAIEYAYAKGSIVVAAAGNNGCDCMLYPAQYPIVLSVGAIDQNGARASFSSYGANLDVTAPGVGITSSSFTNINRISAYATGSGTSFASPLVSGLVSRLRAQLPSATPAQLQALLTEQTQQVRSGQVSKTTQFGYGNISFSNTAARATTPKTVGIAYLYGSVAEKSVFNNPKAQTIAYACEPSAIGTTPIYKGNKLANNFYTINEIDVRQAQNNGYSLTVPFMACVLQPHDIVDSLRFLQTPLEFDNLSLKTLLSP